MVKAYVCKAAEWVTREAMQIHGGMGYAEEFTVSRLFVDARVLSIFEGADETLCLKVIARTLCDANAKPPDRAVQRRCGARSRRSRHRRTGRAPRWRTARPATQPGRSARPRRTRRG